MSYCSKKGYRAEHAVEQVLLGLGDECYRPRAGRHNDVGDIGGIPFVISIKDHARLDLAGWCDDLVEMVRFSGHASGVVWHKRVRKGDPRQWYVTTTGELFLPLYRRFVGLDGPL